MIWRLVLAALLCAIQFQPVASRAAAGIPAFYGDPPDQHHPWAVHDPNRPQPRVVTPGTFSSQEQPGQPPSDAVVLFDGSDLSKWESAKDNGGPAKWTVKNGILEVAPSTGDIRTREEFGDCQLHVEWAEPANVTGASQGRGNSGIFLMGICEIQVLDSFNNITYADGHAGSVYGVNPPAVNVIRPPGQFQVYDIVFRRPLWREGKMMDPGYVTVFINGVLVQDHTPLEGPTGHMKRSTPAPYPEKGPLKLQDHGNPVRFRNIWYRPLPPRAIEGGTDGVLSAEATQAKRAQIASEIRKDASAMTDSPGSTTRMLRFAESLEYEKDADTVQTVNRLAGAYVTHLKQIPAAELASKKDEVKQAASAFGFLAKFDILPSARAIKSDLDQIIKAQGWDKK